MPEKRTIERARQDKREGKAPSTQAGEFVREEIDHIREGKHGARSTKQAIAIGLSKARRAAAGAGERNDLGTDAHQREAGAEARCEPQEAVREALACDRNGAEARRTFGGVKGRAVASGTHGGEEAHRQRALRLGQTGGTHERPGRAFGRGTEGGAHTGAGVGVSR